MSGSNDCVAGGIRRSAWNSGGILSNSVQRLQSTVRRIDGERESEQHQACQEIAPDRLQPRGCRPSPQVRQPKRIADHEEKLGMIESA